MTSCAEVGGSEAEEHGNRAAIAALVLEEVSAVLVAHLQGGRRGRGRDKGVVLVDTLPLVPYTNTLTSHPSLTSETYLGGSHVRTPATHQLLWIVVITGCLSTHSLSSVVRLQQQDKQMRAGSLHTRLERGPPTKLSST